MKKLLLAIGLTAALLLFSGCAVGQNPSDYTDTYFFGMDTYITLRLANKTVDGEEIPEEEQKSAAEGCANILKEADRLFSAHNEKSELYALNQSVNVMMNADSELLALLDTVFALHDATDGAYDPTLGGLSDLWNVTGGGPVPSEEAIAAALSHTGCDKFTVSGTTITKSDMDTKLDLGGAGKGYAAGKLLHYLSQTKIPYGLVSLGGNIGVFGEKPDGEPYKIGIKDPNNTDGVIGYLSIKNGFLSVSGDYERFFYEGSKRYHHILDPKTGYPAESGLRSVACYASNGTTADALSTALFVMGVDRAMALYEEETLSFEAIFVTSDNRVLTTPGIADQFDLTNDRYTMDNCGVGRSS